VAGYIVVAHLGVFKTLLAVDFTFISLGLVAFHLVVSGYLGWAIYRRTRGQRALTTGWLCAEIAMMLGMIGTVAGFIFTLVTALSGGIDPAQLNTVVSTIATGIGTASWTTLVGLIVALSIKVQAHLLEGALDAASR
jgi:hypothetical protein